MLRLIQEWFWPKLEPPSKKLADDQAQLLERHKQTIEQGDWAEQSNVALEEARRLFDAEQERRRSADNKAGIYLAAITALIPVLATLLPNLWADDIHKVFAGVSLLIFGLALIYLFRAALWAFSTIKVSGFAQLGPADIARSWESGSPEEELAKKLLQSVLYNFNSTNEKVSCIKMTHEFLLRAFFCFVAFLAIQAIWPISTWMIELFSHKIGTVPLLYCL